MKLKSKPKVLSWEKPMLSPIQSSEGCTNYHVYKTPASAGAQREVLIYYWRSCGEGMERALKCLLRSRSGFCSEKKTLKLLMMKKKKLYPRWAYLGCDHVPTVSVERVCCPIPHKCAVKKLIGERTNRPIVKLSGDQMSTSKSRLVRRDL